MNRALPVSLLAALLLALGTACGPDAPSSPKRKALVQVDSLNAFGERELFTVRKADGVKEGKYQRWSSSGHLLEETQFSEGKPDQMRILFFENRDTQIVEHYRQGIFHGPYRLYYPQGKLQLEGQYQENKMEGIWVKYYENGGVMEQVTFKDNLENGPFREFYPNGVLKVEGNYRNGDREQGQIKFYDENGRHVKTMDCQDGLCRTIWRIAE